MSQSSDVSRISLLDLSKQIAFDLDKKIKKQLCFSECLIISCAHYEGDNDDLAESTSDWTCTSTTRTETTGETPPTKPPAPKPVGKIEIVQEEEDTQEDDFQFYFFPDCNKPLPSIDSKASVIVVDGLPKLNVLAKERNAMLCTCKKNKKGECTCYFLVPCACGAKKIDDCTCNVKNICLCDDMHPKPDCDCASHKTKVCVCEDVVKVKCTCGAIDRPCVCVQGQYPKPICTCPHKPPPGGFNTSVDDESYPSYYGEHETKTQTPSSLSERAPCECQRTTPVPEKVCECVINEKCKCNEGTCVCDVIRPCVCKATESRDPLCKDTDTKSICSCPDTRECLCAGMSATCVCFPKKEEKVCTCGNSENCRCFYSCDCDDPCICDTQRVKEEVCVCLDKKKVQGLESECTCRKPHEKNKLKRVRATKHGYRWCHDVDPRHTLFDYAYDRHDKIECKESEPEVFKISGLSTSKSGEEETECPVHGPTLPSFKKKVRKPSLDCCSAVGGITIAVEALGEDRDKLLVQIVTHSSKEGSKTSSKLISIIDCNLHTMEENRVESITKNGKTKERRSYTCICERGYYTKLSRICDDRDYVKRTYFTFEDSKDFLLEGSNIVLLRYLALQRIKGTVKTETVLMDGTVCQSVYVCSGVSQAVVNSTPLHVVKIERHIIEPSGFIHQSLVTLTLRGYMISHEWADTSYIVHINPLLKVIPENDEIEYHAPLRDHWRNDLQLLSDYLDFKSARTSEGARYLAESSALKSTVRDFLQALLVLRPQDALNFTRHYFASALSSLDLPHDEFFDPYGKHVRYFFFEE